MQNFFECLLYLNIVVYVYVCSSHYVIGILMALAGVGGQTNTETRKHMYITTYRLNQPRDRLSEK